MDEAVATGRIENLGETGMAAIEEWWNPLSMKEKCPGLPNWETLTDLACAETFLKDEPPPAGMGAPIP